MPKVSRNQLHPTIHLHLIQQLLTTIQQSSTQASPLLLQLLTATEKTMLAKRLVTALLLNQHYSQKQISQLLKVSFSKTGTIATWLNHASPNTIDQLNQLSQLPSWHTLLTSLTKFTTTTLPKPKSPSATYVRSSKFFHK